MEYKKKAEQNVRPFLVEETTFVWASLQARALISNNHSYK